MGERPSFGGSLGRLLVRRDLDVLALAELAGFAESGLSEVLNGVAPDTDLVLRLASVLDLHAVDLLVLADLAIPETLAPLDFDAGLEMPRLVEMVKVLSPKSRDEIPRFARDLPRRERERPYPEPKSYEHYSMNPGAFLVRMMANRNLNWVRSAKVLSSLTNLHVSASTIGVLAHGRKELTPEVVSAFCAVLGLEAGDAGAFFGFSPAASTVTVGHISVDLSALIWESRMLTAEQIREVQRRASLLRDEA
jgi:plasmid maintenance system antidote protein VapI